jgi:leader peptidase (prepilin peptidase)/N-methyltransferase
VIELLALALAGLAVGAFSNLLIERLPVEILAADEDEASGAATTPPHGRRWKAARRIIVSAATAGLFMFAVDRYQGDWLRIGATALFASVFLTLAVIDLEHQLLPDKIVLPALVAGLATTPFLGHLEPWDGALGGAVGFLVFLPIWGWALLTGREGRIMGFGDVKFTAMMGAALGLQFLGVALYAGVLLGGVVAAGLLLARLLAPRVLGMTRVMPYGTFLAIGGLIALFYGRPIVDRIIDILA